MSWGAEDAARRLEAPERTPILEAFHLPALTHVPTTAWAYGAGDAGVQLRVPQLTPQLLQAQVASLLDAGRQLAERPLREIVAQVDRVAGRFTDPADPLRRTAEAALPAVTGYSPAMISRGLDRAAADWRGDRLWQLLREEFGEPEVLDGFRERGDRGRRTRAYGPRLTTHVFSGNVPGVAVTSLIRALLVKSASLGKTAAGEPLLPVLFAQGLAEADPELGACIAITYWPGGNEALERIALEAAEAVIAYGGSEVIASLRGRTPPLARFLGYGHKLSFAVVAREELSAGAAPALARLAALEVATYDQQGCVSPHLFYVEEGGEVAPREWASQLAAALSEVEDELPRGVLSPSEAAAIRQQRGEAEFQQIGGAGVELHASPGGTAWTVIFDPDPAFAGSCLNRLVRVKPIERMERVPELIAQLGTLVQTVGVAADGVRLNELAESLGRLGASRVTPIGAMAWPPPPWHHDGRAPLADLVRWCDLEAPIRGPETGGDRGYD